VLAERLGIPSSTTSNAEGVESIIQKREGAIMASAGVRGFRPGRERVRGIP
jgi:hypothetical protein